MQKVSLDVKLVVMGHAQHLDEYNRLSIEDVKRIVESGKAEWVPGMSPLQATLIIREVEK